jgi:hypothetical protein
VPPTTTGPDSGVFDASIALSASGGWACMTETPGKMGKAARNAARQAVSFVRFAETSTGDRESTRSRP